MIKIQMPIGIGLAMPTEALLGVFNENLRKAGYAQIENMQTRLIGEKPKPGVEVDQRTIEVTLK